MNRRSFIAMSTIGVAGLANRARPATSSPDVIVVGAGVFGLWIAYHLQRKGQKVTLIDVSGPGNKLSSSGGHTRITQVDSDNSTYIRSAIESFSWWERMNQSSYTRIIYELGRLRMGTLEAHLERAKKRKENLLNFGITDAEILDPAEMQYRWPQIRSDDMLFGSFHPSGAGGCALRADVGCEVVAKEFETRGGHIAIGHAEAVIANGRVKGLKIRNSDQKLSAQKFVFACGPWMPSIFPDLFRDRLELQPRVVYFYSLPDNDDSLAFPNMPSWTVPEQSIYGVPSIEGYGFKVAPGYAPDSVSDIEGQARDFAYQRFPKLAGMPLKNVRGCQLTKNTNYDFIVDKHPELDNVILAGGASGHGFKHGPTVGEHASRIVLEQELDQEYADTFRFDQNAATEPPDEASRVTAIDQREHV